MRYLTRKSVRKFGLLENEPRTGEWLFLMRGGAHLIRHSTCLSLTDMCEWFFKLLRSENVCQAIGFNYINISAVIYTV